MSDGRKRTATLLVAYAGLAWATPASAAPTEIVSNFNGTAIEAGSAVWFSGVGKLKSLPPGPVDVFVTGASVSFEAGGVAYTSRLPDAVLHLNPGAVSAAVIYDAVAHRWITTTPPRFSGNVFLTGGVFVAPVRISGVKSVRFVADVTASHALDLCWQWGAAVYRGAKLDLGTLGVKAVDDDRVDAFRNSDHAGTPETVKKYVIGGARGGGGSNCTGSYSGTACLAVPPVVGACGNGVKDAEETDVDCGGLECAPCDAGGQCVTPADCSSGTCNAACCAEHFLCDLWGCYPVCEVLCPIGVCAP